MKRIIPLLILLATGCRATPPVDYSDHYWFAGPPMPTNGLTILTNEGYAVCYSENTETPLWAAYRLFSTTNEVPERPSLTFKQDKRTAKPWTSHSDYNSSGYDRGHLAPSAAMGKCYGEDAQRGTFIMSNIVPQTPGLNRGPWRMLEAQAIEWAQEYSNIWVVCGPVFTGEVARLDGLIVIPDQCFKLILRETSKGPDVMAFIMPQGVEQSEPWTNKLTTVDYIESLTHLNFFYELPDKVEDRIEKKQSGLWPEGEE